MLIKDYIAKVHEATGRKNLNILAGILEEFHPGLKVDSFNFDLTTGFMEFLRTHPRGFRVASINYYYDTLCFVLNRAARQYTIDDGYLDVRRLHREEVTKVYLTIDEIHSLAALRLRPAKAAIRDHFIVMCYTGLRFSDEKRLRPEHISGDNIIIRTKKTRENVVIPVHPIVREIFSRWGKQFPRVPSQQCFSKSIKEICRRIGLDEPVFIEYTRFKKIERKFYHKWELVSTHTGRRSFATNAYLAGIQPAKIMLFTGHTTEQSLFKYIHINKTENARELVDHPFFSGK
ncbi:MAG: site-specific integrase [Prevotella sp.]|jgi:integrase|nr:site-specific integrase [Prevotella sp.]